MKPCRKQKKRIALAASGLLEEESWRALQLHLKGCDACRDYAAAVGEICQEHASRIEIEPDLAASARAIARLEKAQATSGAILGAWSLWFKLPRWAWATGLCGLVAVVLIFWRNQPARNSGSALAISSPLREETERPRVNEPSLLRYRLAVNHSWEELDELLTRAEPRFGPDQENISWQAWAMIP